MLLSGFLGIKKKKKRSMFGSHVLNFGGSALLLALECFI